MQEVGPARTTIAEIARRAGVQRPTVYSNFPRESDLFAACQAPLPRRAPAARPLRRTGPGRPCRARPPRVARALRLVPRDGGDDRQHAARPAPAARAGRPAGRGRRPTARPARRRPCAWESRAGAGAARARVLDLEAPHLGRHVRRGGGGADGGRRRRRDGWATAAARLSSRAGACPAASPSAWRPARRPLSSPRCARRSRGGAACFATLPITNRFGGIAQRAPRAGLLARVDDVRRRDAEGEPAVVVDACTLRPWSTRSGSACRRDSGSTAWGSALPRSTCRCSGGPRSPTRDGRSCGTSGR